MNNIQNPYFVILVIYISLIGLCVGSFLNVVILRGLTGENIVYARSKCPKCNTKLKWYMNIPLLSYLFLRGKCAFCSAKISIQYPLVELITSILFTYSFIEFGLSAKLFFVWIALSLFIVMAVTDIKETVIIDIHAYILAVVGLIYSCFNFSPNTILMSICGGIFGFLFFEILSLLTKKIINYRMFGEGDSLIALALGTFFGFKIMLLIIPLSFLLQFVFAIPSLIIDSYKKDKKKLALAYIVITAGIILFQIMNFIHLSQSNFFIYLILSLVISLFLLWALIVLLKDLALKTKENSSQKINDELKTSFFVLPFGPALILAGGLCLFFKDIIVSVVKNFLY